MNSTTFAYRLCNADDFDVWKDLNLAFMQEEIQDEDLWTNPNAKAFYQAIGFQPAEMNFYVKYFNG